MKFTTDFLVRISAAGGGMILDCNEMSSESLVKVATATLNRDTKIILTNINKFNIDALVKIGAAGQGSVIFDFR